MGLFPPTLGGVAAQWIETNCVHGPGDVFGQPVKLTAEERRFLDAAYALDSDTGRRVVQRATYSRRKGSRKTEFAAWVGCFELLGPCRTDLRHGQPVAVQITDPWLICTATTQEQADTTVHGALKAILRSAPNLAPQVDVGQEVTHLLDRPGKITSPAMNPGALDGGKPTWTAAEETHLWVGTKLRECDQVLVRNLRKRVLAQPWLMTVTTAHRPGQNSVGESHHGYGLRVAADPKLDPTVVYDHREAASTWDLTVEPQLRAAIAEAAGDASWYDMDYLAGQFHDPDVAEDAFRRFWLNQSVAGRDVFAAPSDWAPLARQGTKLRRGDSVALGFDGSAYDDSTALVAVRLDDGFSQLLACWSKPEGTAGEGWSVPRQSVDYVVRQSMERFRVVRMECDPPYWRDEVANWRRDFGSVVREFHTARPTTMGPAIERAQSAIRAGAFHHGGDEVLTAHVQAARVVEDRGYPRLAKPREGHKIDAAVAWCIAYDARGRVIGDRLDVEEPEQVAPQYGFAAWS